MPSSETLYRIFREKGCKGDRMPMYRASAPFFMGVRGDRRVTGDLPYPLLQEGDGDRASLSALSVLPLQGESERVFPRSRILERI